MVTADEVKNAMIAKDIETADHHDCSFCGYMCKYVRRGNDLFFDRGCHCTYGGTGLEPCPWQDAADWINTQNGEWQKKIASKFGIDIDAVLSAEVVV